MNAGIIVGYILQAIIIIVLIFLIRKVKLPKDVMKKGDLTDLSELSVEHYKKTQTISDSIKLLTDILDRISKSASVEIKNNGNHHEQSEQIITPNASLSTANDDSKKLYDEALDELLGHPSNVSTEVKTETDTGDPKDTKEKSEKSNKKGWHRR